jgi:hypothetical protein
MNFHGIVGFDVSKWQGRIDFRKMQSGGASFVIVKAGQGNWADPNFAENWKNAKSFLPRASYWYYDNRYPPKEQARKYFDIIRHDLEGMCWLDLEDKNVGLYTGFRNWYDFIEEFKRLYPGARIGIYSGFYYIMEMLGFAKQTEKEYFGKYPLWIANYQPDPFKPNYSSILIPLPWLSYLILQSGTPAIGPEAGVESLEIDYNQFNGDIDRFRQYFSGMTEPPTQPPTEPEGEPMAVSQWYKVTASVLNIRSGPGTNYSDVGDLLLNDIIEVIETIGGWRKFVATYRGGAEIPTPAAAWCKDSYTAITTSPVVTPPPVDPDPAEGYEVETLDFVIVDKLTGKRYRGTIGGLTLVEDVEA